MNPEIQLQIHLSGNTKVPILGCSGQEEAEMPVGK